MGDDNPQIPNGYEEVPPKQVDEDCLAFDPFNANDQDLWSFTVRTEETAPILADDATDDQTRRIACYDVPQHGGYLNCRVPIEGDHNIRFVRPTESVEDR